MGRDITPHLLRPPGPAKLPGDGEMNISFSSDKLRKGIESGLNAVKSMTRARSQQLPSLRERRTGGRSKSLHIHRVKQNLGSPRGMSQIAIRTPAAKLALIDNIIRQREKSGHCLI